MGDYSEIEQQLAALFPQQSESFTEMLGHVIRGEEAFSASVIVGYLTTALQNEFLSMKWLFLSLLLLAIVSAVFNNFSGIFQNKQISNLSFYFAYLLLVNTLLTAFYMAIDTAINLIDTIVRFMEILIPTYYLSVAATSAIGSAASFYQITLILIYAIQAFFPEIILPLVSSYVFCSIISGLSDDDKFSVIIKLIKKFRSEERRVGTEC